LGYWSNQFKIPYTECLLANKRVDRVLSPEDSVQVLLFSAAVFALGECSPTRAHADNNKVILTLVAHLKIGRRKPKLPRLLHEPLSFHAEIAEKGDHRPGNWQNDAAKLAPPALWHSVGRLLDFAYHSESRLNLKLRLLGVAHGGNIYASWQPSVTDRQDS
jgi:hypothetical protein